MTTWTDRRILDLLGIHHPILQAPMAGVQRSALAIAVAEAGALGAVPCSMLRPDEIRDEVAAIRRAGHTTFNLNFSCHRPPTPDPAREAAWRRRLAPYSAELGLDPASISTAPTRAPFDTIQCALIEELRPPVVSFHFGLPSPDLLARVKATGAVILSSATTVAEARHLAADCDAIIAQGSDAGGHRGTFLAEDPTLQIGTLALVPQIVDATARPVIAAGGVTDARGITAALALGAAAVQLGTFYLRCPETTLSSAHRAALRTDRDTTITNLFTGRPARGQVNRLIRDLGPLAADIPDYPLAAVALAPLRAAAEAAGRTDFTPLWTGTALALAHELPAAELTRRLVAETLALLGA